MVAEVLDAADMRMQDLSAVAVAIGPGSFTGLRVGLSYAKGVAIARDIVLAGVPSLDAMALSAGSKLPQGTPVYSMIDARKGEVYAGLYRFSAGALERVSGELLVSLAYLVKQSSDEAVFVGYSIAEQARSLAEANGHRVVLVENGALHLRGGFVAAIGASQVLRKQTAAVAALEPLYVRPPDTATPPIALKLGEDIHGTPRGRTHRATPRS
jgi:tRNA threonylcarbamoyladenosine biosynthesis protein TsaB